MNKEVFTNLSEEYDIPVGRVKNYFAKLMTYQIFEESDEELQRDCLEAVVSDASSNKFFREEIDDKDVQRDHHKSLTYCYSDALFRTYGDQASPYLDDEYRRENSIRYTEMGKSK